MWGNLRQSQKILFFFGFYKVGKSLPDTNKIIHMNINGIIIYDGNNIGYVLPHNETSVNVHVSKDKKINTESTLVGLGSDGKVYGPETKFEWLHAVFQR